MESDSDGQTDESLELSSPAPRLVPEDGAPTIRKEGSKDVVSLALPHPEVLLCPFRCRMAGYKGKDRFASFSRKHLQKEHGLYGYEFVCRFCHKTGSDLRKRAKCLADTSKELLMTTLRKPTLGK